MLVYAGRCTSVSAGSSLARRPGCDAGTNRSGAGGLYLIEAWAEASARLSVICFPALLAHVPRLLRTPRRSQKCGKLACEEEARHKQKSWKDCEARTAAWGHSAYQAGSPLSSALSPSYSSVRGPMRVRSLGPHTTIGEIGLMTGLNDACADGLRGWACRIRTAESVRELSNWNCVTTSPEVGASPAAETLRVRAA